MRELFESLAMFPSQGRVPMITIILSEGSVGIHDCIPNVVRD